MNNIDKIKGSFIGLSLGDALGAPHEFRYQKDIYTGELIYKARLFNRFTGERFLTVGQVTDDTEMMLALLRSLLRNTRFVKEDVILSYLRWANSGTPMMGRNTRKLFKGIKTIKGYKNRWRKEFKENSSSWTQSNGSLMRCLPLALLNDDTPVIYETRLSNPHPINISCNLLYITAVRWLWKGVKKDVAIQGLLQIPKDRKYYWNSDVKQVLLQAYLNKKMDVTGKTKGWVLNAFYCAFYALANTNSYKEGIDKVIHMGGDTDTNAAIAGGLLGSYYGYSEMIKDPTTNKNIQILLNVDTSQGDVQRPEEYLINDIDQIIMQIQNTFL